jgi:hypothetical protein
VKLQWSEESLDAIKLMSGCNKGQKHVMNVIHLVAVLSFSYVHCSSRAASALIRMPTLLHKFKLFSNRWYHLRGGSKILV